MVKEKVKNDGGDDTLVFGATHSLVDVAIKHGYCYCRCATCSADTADDGRGSMKDGHCHNIQSSCFVRKLTSIGLFFRRLR